MTESKYAERERRWKGTSGGVHFVRKKSVGSDDKGDLLGVTFLFKSLEKNKIMKIKQ